MPVFEADEVEFSYGPLNVLNGLTLAVDESEIFGILGANGAGKTTLMRLLIGLQKPSSGAIRVFGESPSSRVTGRIGYMPQLLVLDEPTVGLDPELRATFWEQFRSMASSGTTLIISSHTMDDAAHCHRLAFIQQGHIVALGTPDELRAAVGSDDATLEDAFLHFVRQGGPS